MRRFDRYRLSEDSYGTAETFNEIHLDIDERVHALEDAETGFSARLQALVSGARNRIDDTLLPAFEQVQLYQSGGFLTAPIVADAAVEFLTGETALAIHADHRALFRPSPFIVLTRESTPDDFAIARTLGYNEETGLLAIDIVAVDGDEGPFTDVVVASTSGSAVAQKVFLDATRAARDATIEARNTAVGAKDAASGHAETSATQAGIAAGAAESASTKAAEAQRWAENAEDTAVEPGKFSAKHHAAKAAASALAAQTWDPESYYNKSEIDSALAGKAAASHGHAIVDVSGLSDELAGKASRIDVEVNRANLVLAQLHLAMLGEFSLQKNVDGFYDTFEDDAGASNVTGILYDAGRKAWLPSLSGASENNYGGKGDRRSFITVTTDLNYNGTLQNLVDGVVSNAISVSDATLVDRHITFDFGKPVTVSTLTIAKQAGAWGSWLFQASHDGVDWQDQRSGGLNVNASPAAFSVNQNVDRYRYYRLFGVANGSAASWLQEVTFSIRTVTNATLRSQSVQALAQPTFANLYVIEADGLVEGGVELNTDLIAEVSRDDGATWTAATLVEKLAIGDSRFLVAEADLSGQPAGTAMRWQLRTQNNVDLSIEAVGMTWR